MNSETLRISDRFCGPPNSGNGGYVCGLLARDLPGTVMVRLRAPPPLNTLLRREWTDESARLLHEGSPIGEARVTSLQMTPPPCPTLAQAQAAASDYPGFRQHLFPRCFVCGPAREPGDGLRVFSGPVAGKSLHAAPWVPDASLSDGQGRVAPEFVWAALDCPSGFAVLPVPEGSAIVLGELTATIGAAASLGEALIVTSWPIAHEGRRRTAGTAIHSADGAVIAVARAVWVEVPQASWTAAKS